MGSRAQVIEVDVVVLVVVLCRLDDGPVVDEQGLDLARLVPAAAAEAFHVWEGGGRPESAWDEVFWGEGAVVSDVVARKGRLRSVDAGHVD